MLFTPEQFLLLGAVLLGGLLIGYACAPSPRKWKRRVRTQSDSFTEHYAALEEQLRVETRRADDLEARANALRADHVEAERTIGTLRAAAMAAPVTVLATEVAHRPAPVVVEPEPVAMPEPVAEPVAEAEWTPVVAEPEAAHTVSEPVSTIAPDPLADAPVAHVASESAVAAVEPAAEIAPTSDTTEPRQDVSDETPKGAPAPGETFPHAEDSVAPGKDPAPLSADPTATDAALSEPVVEHPEPAQQPTPEPAIVAPMTPVATDAPPAPIGPAEPEMPSKGWFASSARDDLTRLRGIDGPLNTRLFSLGVVRFEDLEKLSAEDEMALEQRLALPVGYIAREQWRTQSALLRAGQTEEHATHFAKEPVAVG